VTRRIVVAGAGLGGLRAAEQLRAQGWAEEIVVIGAEPHPPYNRPPLSKEALRDIDSLDIGGWQERLAFRQRASTSDVEWRLGQQVRSADLAGRTLTSDGTTIEWDGLVVATGLRSRRLPATAPRAGRYALRTLDDAVRLRSRLVPGARLVVVGGGFIGCEVAATATQLGCRVTIVEPLSSPMALGLGVDLGRVVGEYLRLNGVDVRSGRLVSRLEACHGGDRVGAAVLDDGETLDADLVVESVGSHPNTEWLAGTGLDLSDGVRCDEHLRVEGLGAVVAVGDVARFPNLRYDEIPRRVEHWSMPTDCAKHAAGTLVRTLTGTAEDRAPFAPLPSFWSDQLDLRIQSFGFPSLADETYVVSGVAEAHRLTDGVVVHYARAGRLVGVVLVNPAGSEIRDQRRLVDAATSP
jgi:NADPH-dependent 2,4-dienoyl-CoA reductase/sulfur reductase-like enzyme